MSVYKRGSIYYYSVTINGKTIRRSTGQKSLKAAEAVEQRMLQAGQNEKAAQIAFSASSVNSSIAWKEQIDSEQAKPNAGIVGILCRRARNRAAEMNREFLITDKMLGLALVACGGRCSVTGMPISIHGKQYERPSIDRIDSARGYTLDNIRITSVIANLAMNKWGEPALREMCGHYAFKILSGI